MTTDTTVFSDGAATQSTAPASATTDAASLLNALVGEKQKYKSVEELAKAYANADEFIQRLKEENEALRKQAEKVKSVDDILNQLTQIPPKKADTPSQDATTISAEAVAEIVKNTLTGYETQKTREANLLKADKLMKEKFGEKALEVFRNSAQTPEKKKALTELAAVDPDQFVQIFIQPASGSTTVDQSKVNSAAMANAPSHNSEWSKDWVAEVRKKDPGRYWSAEFQYQLQNKVSQNPRLYFKE